MASGGFSLPHPSVGLASSSSSSSGSPLRGCAVPCRAACRPQGCQRDAGSSRLPSSLRAQGRYLRGRRRAGEPPLGCGDIGRRPVRGRRRGTGAPVPAPIASHNSPFSGQRAGWALAARRGSQGAQPFISSRCRAAGGSGL